MLEEAAGILWELIGECRHFDLIADVPTAATPLVSAVAVLHGAPMITPHQPKDHGTKGTIDGDYSKGDRVILIDDLITTAQSKLIAIEILENEGLRVTDVCVLVDREQGGREALEEAGYELHAACTMREILLGLKDSFEESAPENITQEQIEQTLEYLSEQTQR